MAVYLVADDDNLGDTTVLSERAMTATLRRLCHDWYSDDDPESHLQDCLNQCVELEHYLAPRGNYSVQNALADAKRLLAPGVATGRAQREIRRILHKLENYND